MTARINREVSYCDSNSHYIFTTTRNYHHHRLVIEADAVVILDRVSIQAESVTVTCRTFINLGILDTGYLKIEATRVCRGIITANKIRIEGSTIDENLARNVFDKMMKEARSELVKKWTEIPQRRSQLAPSG